MSEITKDNQREFKPRSGDGKREFKPRSNDGKRDFKKRKPRMQQKDPFEERVIQINRITKVTKGGRVMRFAALVVVGDRKGKVAVGTAKANEVPVAIKKAIQDAKKNLVNVDIAKNSTVFHDLTGKWGASKVLIKPAPEGKGIIAGGAIRSVVELAGIKNIYTKNLGSNNPINIVRATINALSSQMTAKQVAFLRDKELSEL